MVGGRGPYKGTRLFASKMCAAHAEPAPSILLLMDMLVPSAAVGFGGVDLSPCDRAKRRPSLCQPEHLGILLALGVLGTDGDGHSLLSQRTLHF